MTDDDNDDDNDNDDDEVQRPSFDVVLLLSLSLSLFFSIAHTYARTLLSLLASLSLVITTRQLSSSLWHTRGLFRPPLHSSVHWLLFGSGVCADLELSPAEDDDGKNLLA